MYPAEQPLSPERSTVLQREAEIHDQLAYQAASADPSPVPVGPYEHSVLDRLGSLHGMRVLELGCGAGDLTFELLDRGAEVTALDLSDGMVELARKRVAHYRPGAQVLFVTASAESTGLPDGVFDAVVGKWVLHHVDLSAVAPELRRVLASGGRGMFMETSGMNPVLRFARKRVAGRLGVPRYGTPDERPIERPDIALLRQSFRAVDIIFPDLLFFRLFDRQVLRYRSRMASRALAFVDDWLGRRWPRLRRLSFNIVLDVRR